MNKLIKLVMVLLLAGAFMQCRKEITERIIVEKGAKGATIHSGSGVPSPDRGNIGDYYIDITTAELYGAKTASGWGVPLSLLGDTGLQGDVGDKGETGDKGDTGLTGDKGATGDKGETGDKGDKGQQGDKGATGDKGDKGIVGDKGDKGDKGYKGLIGETGLPGGAGTQLLSGNVAPTAAIGAVGDLYLEVSERVLYGPKTDTGWGTGIRLGYPPLAVSKESIILAFNRTATLTITSGSGNYTIEQEATSQAKLQVTLSHDQKSLTLKSLDVGKVTFTLKDAHSGKQKTIEVEMFSNSPIQPTDYKVYYDNGRYDGSVYGWYLSEWLNENTLEIDMENHPELSKVTMISHFAFIGKTKLTKVILPNKLKEIKKYVFKGCTNLTQIELPNSLEKIRNGAFEGSGLTSIVIPENTKFINTDVAGSYFEDCKNLTTVEFKGNKITEIPDCIFKGCTNLKTINIPQSVTEIEISAFNGCSNLKEITLPNGLKKINSNAFRQTGLETITIPESVEFIGWGSFYGCTNLKSVQLPNNLTQIEENTFEGCVNLKSIQLPNNLTQIGKEAFENCTSLETINIPPKVTKIRRNTFYNCKKLTNITLPKGLKEIEELVFVDCANLKTITIPSTVTTIGDWAFSGTGLRQVIVEATTPPTLGANVFQFYWGPIYVPKGTANIYRKAPGWSEYSLLIREK